MGPCMAFFASEVLLLGLMLGGLARCGYGLPLLADELEAAGGGGLHAGGALAVPGSAAVLALPAGAGALRLYCGGAVEAGVF